MNLDESQLNSLGQHGSGFKTAFYEYTEQFEQQIGSQMNRIYSMSINIYRRLKDIEGAIAKVFSNSYDAEVRQPNLFIVLVYDFIMANNKLKIGGKLSRMVKDNEVELRAILGSIKEDKMAHLPKFAYLRLNKLRTQEGEGNESEDEREPVDVIRAGLKEEGFKVKRM